jgi:HK97 family phage prohead protease
MPEHMIVPVEWKAAATGGAGELEGYASVFGNLDQGGDVVMPGAFKKTLADWSRAVQPLPLIADHNMSTEGVIGSVRQAKEDGIGLWIKAGFSKTPKAQDIRTKMIEGHLKGMSFTYDAVRHRMGQFNGKSARFLEELKLFEATVTPFPMNTLAIASAKAAMTSASVNDLPDSAFAYIEPGGKKDAEGKTTPRSLRHFPVHDEAHARNALARLSSSPFAAQARPKVMAAARKFGIEVSSSSIDFEEFNDLMTKALSITYGPASKAAADLLIAAYLDNAAALADEEGTADAAAGTTDNVAAGTAEKGSDYSYGFLVHPPEPHDGALDPLAQLETERANASLDRVEAEIRAALGAHNG